MAKARLTLLHIVRSLLFVLLVPLQFVSSLPSRHLQFHRWTGRLILVLGVVLGVSALLLSVRPDGVAVEGMATIWFRLFPSGLPRPGMVAPSRPAPGSLSGVGQSLAWSQSH